MKTIKVERQGLFFDVSADTQKKFGKDLAIFNPKSLSSILDFLPRHYPVDKHILPEVPKHNKIGENTNLNPNYGLTSQELFDDFIKKLESSVDLITRNDFLVNAPINVYKFSI